MARPDLKNWLVIRLIKVFKVEHSDDLIHATCSVTDFLSDLDSNLKRSLWSGRLTPVTSEQVAIKSLSCSFLWQNSKTWRSTWSKVSLWRIFSLSSICVQVFSYRFLLNWPFALLPKISWKSSLESKVLDFLLPLRFLEFFLFVWSSTEFLLVPLLKANTPCKYNCSIFIRSKVYMVFSKGLRH